MKIHPVGAELLHADNRTDRHDKLIIALRNFANESKNCEKYRRSTYRIVWQIGSYLDKQTEEASFVTLRAPKEKRLPRNEWRKSRCMGVGTINRQRKSRNAVCKHVKEEDLLCSCADPLQIRHRQSSAYPTSSTVSPTTKPAEGSS